MNLRWRGTCDENGVKNSPALQQYDEENSVWYDVPYVEEKVHHIKCVVCGERFVGERSDCECEECVQAGVEAALSRARQEKENG